MVRMPRSLAQMAAQVTVFTLITTNFLACSKARMSAVPVTPVAQRPIPQPVSSPVAQTPPVETMPSTGQNPEVAQPTVGTTPYIPPVVVQPPVITPPPVIAVPSPTPTPVVTTPPPSSAGRLLFAVTPFANMASGYQATNPGFVAILRNESRQTIAAGWLTMDAVVDGYSDDASRGSAYGRLVLNVKLQHMAAQGSGQGALSICMSENPEAPMAQQSCRELGGNLHPERPFQYIDMPVSYEATGNGEVRVGGFRGDTGEGGSSEQIALAVYHPAFAFAAPGKAFKDFQSPLVLDLDMDGQLNLVDVWDETKAVRFDLECTGTAQRTGWVAAQDGLLAMDLNGNGRIDDGGELFGEYSQVGPNTKKYKDGYQALATLDANGDGVIDARDGEFGKLLIWQDRNQDGVTQKGELKTLAQHGITALPLAHRDLGVKPSIVAGNEVRLIGTFRRGAEEFMMGDVWFKQRRLLNAQVVQ